MKRALLQMHLAVLLWGFTGILGRAIDLEASVIVWYRMLFTALIILGIILYRRQWVTIPGKDMRLVTWVGCLMGLHWVAFYGSIKLANASIALICLSSASIFTTLVHTLVYKTKPNLKEIAIGLIALAGVLLMYFVPHSNEPATGEISSLKDKNAGIILGVIAAIISAVFTILNKRIAGKYPVRMIVFYEMGTGWLLISLLLPFQFIFQPDISLKPSVLDLIWLLILAFFCTVWAQSLALSALQKITSFTATLSVNLEPVYGVILAFLLFQENKELHWDFYAGMGMILFSVLLQMYFLLRSQKSR